MIHLTTDPVFKNSISRAQRIGDTKSLVQSHTASPKSQTQLNDSTHTASEKNIQI